MNKKFNCLEGQIVADTVIGQTNGNYNASNIQVLEGLEPVRVRPGMYIGSTDYRGLHHLIWEIVDNSVDEALAGHARNIEVLIDKNNVVTATDDGRGIPTDMHPTKHRPALEIVMTVLHAGGKFGGGGYKVSGGLHGVGASVVNALSTWLQVEVRRDGKAYSQEYHRGIPVADMQVRDLTVEEIAQHPRGTITKWLADDTIFDTLAYNYDTVAQRFRETCFLTKALHIHLVDERNDKEVSFYFEGGVMSFVRHLNKNRGVVQQKPFYTQRGSEGVDVEVAFQYTDGYNDSIHAFANNINTPDGGTHLTGFRTAMTRTINNYARKNGYLKEKDENLTGDDIRQGLTAIISVKLTDPQFEGQTKAKLGNANVKGVVESALGDSLTTWLEENPNDARKIVDKCMTAQRIREAQSKLKDTILRKSAFDGMTLPGKLADCSERDPSRSEIFIVEGDSAGGCFVGETGVALASGIVKTLAELALDWKQGIQHFGYATNQAGNVRVVPLLEPRLTKRQARLVEVVLDNSARLRCTPDHLFRLQNGSYRAASQLVPGQSLMSLIPSTFFKQELLAALLVKVRQPQLQTAQSVSGHSSRSFAKDGLHLPVAGVKVVSVQELNEQAEVYDLTVEGYHNFALADGVFVHNSAKQGRDRRFQAILPLRGKILNVERASLDKMLSSTEIRALITALGAGLGDSFDSGKLRYHRAIIMTDADVDGSHIRTLLLTFFFRNMRQLVADGYLYIAQPPLYRVAYGKEKHYAYNEADRDILVKRINKDNVNIQRYKGLGEMNPDQLWETTMDPSHRTLLQVTIEDAAMADETFQMLMGDAVPPRKQFITTHAKSVKNLDI